MSSRAVTLILLIDAVFSTSILQCPLNKTEWESRSAEFYCQGNEVYHCFLMEDTLSRKEKCIEITMIGEGHCPIFTTTGYLHWKSCNGTGCPQDRYRSDEVYKYPVCYGDIKDKTNRLQRSNENEGEIKLGLGLGLGIGILLLLIAFIVAMIVVRRRHKDTDNTIQEDGNLKKEGEMKSLIPQDHHKGEFIDKGVAILTSGRLLYVVGKLGNAVSTTGKDIVKTFAHKYNMRPCYYHYLDIPDEFPPETVNFIDGWCGLWNNNPCEMQTAREKLKKITSSCKPAYRNVKFVVGIRTDVKQVLCKHKNHPSEHETLVLDTYSKSKQDIVENELKLTQSKCPNNTCKCKSLTMEDVNNISHGDIGTPLIVNLIDIDHSMIQGFLKKKTGPMKAIQNHIKDLQSNETDLFNVLLYIVVVGYYDHHEFNEKFAQEFDIGKNCLENYAKLEKLQKYTKTIEKSKLASLWSAKINEDNFEKSIEGTSGDTVHVFWHSFLYICAFHVCFSSYPDKMMRICNIDALLQLLRPTTWRPEPFTVAVDTKLVDIFRERIKGTPYEDKLSKHPLIAFRKRKSFNRRNVQRKRDNRASNIV